MKYEGSCHCERVRFTVEAPEEVDVYECNCSVCAKSGFQALILPLSKFEVLAGEDNLTTYTFNTGVARHTFCKTCGVKPFYVPRTNPDGIGINVRCLTPAPRKVNIKTFDGINWEDHAHRVTHLSKDE